MFTKLLVKNVVILSSNLNFAGGLNIGVFEGCLVGEEFAFGCTGIATALEASGLGVSYK